MEYGPHVHIVRVTDWRPSSVERALAASPRNFVGLMKDGCTVLKYPCRKTESAMQALYEEAARYEYLDSHEHLVVFKGIHKDGLMFEYCAQGELEQVIQSQPTLTKYQKAALAKQIALGLIHLHQRHFIHCDLSVRNIFVTTAMDAKIGDIQGQLYQSDGTVLMPSMSQENLKSRHPHAGEDEFSPRTDIFALGTVLYHLWHGHPPFPELDENRDEKVIQARYRQGIYPIDESEATGMDAIVSKCWRSSYHQVVDVLRDLEGLDMA